MSKYWATIVSAGLLLGAAASSYGEIYEWVDANGKKHYTDRPTKEALAGEGQSLAPVSVTTNTYEGSEVSNTEVAKVKYVEMYATSWCGYCRKARQHFAREGITYTEYDIEKDASANARHKAMGGRGVPVILVDGRKMNGFSEAGFARLYANQ